MIGLSSSYYATKGYNIYESVQRVVDLGFNVVELGAAHNYEENVWETLRRLKSDFPHIIFTVHQYFPANREKIWFNPAEGLSSTNKQIIDHLFKSASIMEASIVSIHEPIIQNVSVGPQVTGNFYEPILSERKDEQLCKKNFIKLMEYADNKAEESGTRVIIENMNTKMVDTFQYAEEFFFELFNKFSNSGLLLDVGHALQCGNLNTWLNMSAHVQEVHLHDAGITTSGKVWAHFPVKDQSYFEPVKNILKEKDLPLIFEHGADVSESEIIYEKQLFDSFQKTLNDKS